MRGWPKAMDRVNLRWFFVLMVALLAACDGASQETSVGQGFCTPGTVKLESGAWYSCGGGNWQVDAGKALQGEAEVIAKLESGQTLAFFPLLAVTAVDPIPGDEIVVLIFGGLTIAAVSVNATANLQVDMPPLWTMDTVEEFQTWKGALELPAELMDDQVGVYPVESPIEAEDFNLRFAPTGSVAIVIEDSPIWASLIVASLKTAGIQVIAVYPSCDAWRAGLVKLAHVYVVDQHSEGASPGHTCIAEIASLVPPPVIIAGFSAEFLDHVTEQWSPGVKSSVRELMEEAGADFVVHKIGTGGILELILLILRGLGV